MSKKLEISLRLSRTTTKSYKVVQVPWWLSKRWEILELNKHALQIIFALISCILRAYDSNLAEQHLILVVIFLIKGRYVLTPNFFDARGTSRYLSGKVPTLNSKASTMLCCVYMPQRISWRQHSLGDNHYFSPSVHQQVTKKKNVDAIKSFKLGMIVIHFFPFVWIISQVFYSQDKDIGGHKIPLYNPSLSFKCVNNPSIQEKWIWHCGNTQDDPMKNFFKEPRSHKNFTKNPNSKVS